MFEVGMECDIAVYQLTDSTELESQRGENVDDMVGQLQQYEENLSYSFISATEKLLDVIAKKLPQEFQ